MMFVDTKSTSNILKLNINLQKLLLFFTVFISIIVFYSRDPLNGVSFLTHRNICSFNNGRVLWKFVIITIITVS